MATIAEQLANYIGRMTIGDLPPEVVDKTKLHILDTIGCVLAGSLDRVAVTVGAHAVRHGPAGPCSVLGRAETVGPAYAAMANGTAAHVLVWDDGHKPSSGHIGGAVVPAALAMAEATGASGSDLLLAVVLGYDAMGRVGESVGMPKSAGRQSHGKIHVFGTGAAAGKLLGLNSAQLANTLGIAGDSAAGLREMRPTGEDMMPLHVGRAGHAGITAAYLAAEGLHGSATIFEGRRGFCVTTTPTPRPDLICVELGERFAIMESQFKVYPCVENLHTPIGGALRLRGEYKLDPGSIQRIRIGVPDWARDDYDGRGTTTGPGSGRQRRPTTVGNARFSMSFTCAAALHDGEITPRQFTPSKLVDPGIAALEQRVEFVADPEVEAIFRMQKLDAPFFFIPYSLEVESGGQTYRRVVRTPSTYNPETHTQQGFGQAEVVAKFHSIADQLLSRRNADLAVDLVLGLDSGAKVATLVDLLRGYDAGEARRSELLHRGDYTWQESHLP